MKFNWVTISVSDMKRSLEFYRDLLGLAVTGTINPAPGLEIVFLGSGDTKVELICNSGSAPEGFGGGISLGFEAGPLEAFVEVLKGKGIPVHSGPFQPNPHLRFLYVLDPDGLKIQLAEHK